MSKKTIWFTTKTLSFRVLVFLIFFNIMTMTGNALPDNEISGQLNSEPTAVYVLDAGHHHLGDGVKPELLPTDAEDTVYTKTFFPERIDGDTAGITLTTKSVVPTDTAGIGLFYVRISGNENLLVLDGNTGEQVWKGGKTFGHEVSQPVLSHGRLYMSASDSRLYAFEPANNYYCWYIASCLWDVAKKEEG